MALESKILEVLAKLNTAVDNLNSKVSSESKVTMKPTDNATKGSDINPSVNESDATQKRIQKEAKEREEKEQKESTVEFGQKFMEGAVQTLISESSKLIDSFPGLGNGAGGAAKDSSVLDGLKVGKLLKTLGIGVAILAAAFLYLQEDIDWDKVTKILISVAATLAILKFLGKDSKEGADALLNTAISIALLLGALLLAEVIADQISLAGIGTMALILLAFGGLLFVLSKVKENTDKARDAAINATIVSVSILAFVAILWVLGFLINVAGGTIFTGLIAMAVLLVAFWGIAVLMDKVGSKLVKAWIGVAIALAFAAILLLFALSLKMIGDLQWGAIFTGLLGLIGVIAIMTALALGLGVLATFAPMIFLGLGALMMMSMALFLFAIGLHMISTIDPKAVETAIAGLLSISLDLIKFFGLLALLAVPAVVAAVGALAMGTTMILLVVTFVLIKMLGSVDITESLDRMISVSQGLLRMFGILALATFPALLALVAAVAILATLVVLLPTFLILKLLDGMNALDAAKSLSSVGESLLYAMIFLNAALPYAFGALLASILITAALGVLSLGLLMFGKDSITLVMSLLPLLLKGIGVINKSIDSLSRNIVKILKALGDAISKPFNIIRDIIDSIGNAIVNVISSMKDAFSSFVDDLDRLQNISAGGLWALGASLGRIAINAEELSDISLYKTYNRLIPPSSTLKKIASLSWYMRSIKNDLEDINSIDDIEIALNAKVEVNSEDSKMLQISINLDKTRNDLLKTQIDIMNEHTTLLKNINTNNTNIIANTSPIGTQSVLPPSQPNAAPLTRQDFQGGYLSNV